MPIKHVVFFLMLLLTLSACETVPVDKDIIHARMIVVLPAQSMHKELQKYSEEMQDVAIKLVKKKDFKVQKMSLQEFESIQADALTVSGSMYDPTVGKLMPLNPSVYKKALIDLTRERYAFDVIIVPEILLTSAKIVGDKARWDGVEKSLEWKAKPKETVSLPNRISALSARINTYTSTGVKIVSQSAGIDLPYELSFEGSIKQNLKSVLFTSAELTSALKLAMKPFFNQVKYDE